MREITSVKQLSVRWNDRLGTRKLGVIVYSAVSLLLMLIGSPMIQWLGVRNVSALAGAIEVKAPGVFAGYSLFNLLSFVQASGVGILGIPAMLLMLMAVAAIILHLLVLIDLIRGEGTGGSLLLRIPRVQAGMALSFLTGIGSLLFMAFANHVIGVAAFAPSPMVMLSLVLSLFGYLVMHQVRREERRLYHEHGFFEELRRNWVLFLFLVPCFLFLIINNYLPMAGVYFAFTQFNFRDGLFSSPFIGLKNFEFLFKADLFKLTRNTVLYNTVFIVVGNVLQIFFAILVSRVLNDRIKKVTQTLIFMPYFVSYVILKVFGLQSVRI